MAPRSLAPRPRPARGQPLSGCADRRPSAPARVGVGTADGRARLASTIRTTTSGSPWWRFCACWRRAPPHRYGHQAGGVRAGLLPQRSGVAAPGETAREPGHLRAVIAARRARYAPYCAITVPDDCTDLDALERFARGQGAVPPGAARRLLRRPSPALAPPVSARPQPLLHSSPHRRHRASSPSPPQPLTLRGLGVSAGQRAGHGASNPPAGRVRAPCRPGDILVCPATDPSWSPLFPLVRGLVVEIGGQLSHGSIVAREYSIPAVVNVPQATEPHPRRRHHRARRHRRHRPPQRAVPLPKRRRP